MRTPSHSYPNDESSTHRAGFTLIEVLVVISVTALLGALVITSSKAGERQIALTIETQKLASVLSRAKSLALATYADVNPNRCGYGVLVDGAAKTYSLFAYQEPNPPNCASLSSIPPDFRAILSTYRLDSRVTFENAADSLSIVLFVPPNPATLLSADDGATFTATALKVHLVTSDGVARRAITVTPFGQINF